MERVSRVDVPEFSETRVSPLAWAIPGSSRTSEPEIELDGRTTEPSPPEASTTCSRPDGAAVPMPTREELLGKPA